MQADFFVFSRSQQMNLHKFELVKGMMQMELMKKDIGKWVISQNLDGYILSIDVEGRAAVVKFFDGRLQKDRIVQFENLILNDEDKLQLQDLLALQELALDTNDKKWFDELSRQIAKFKVEF